MSIYGFPETFCEGSHRSISALCHEVVRRIDKMDLSRLRNSVLDASSLRGPSMRCSSHSFQSSRSRSRTSGKLVTSLFAK